MSHEGDIYFNGCMPVRGAVPGFATPLFGCVGDNREFMQDLDEDFTLKGLRQIDVAPGTPVMRDVPIIYCDFSEGSYFAFAQNGPGILIGHRGELAKTLLASFNSYSEFPAAQLSIVRFAGDTDLARKAEWHLGERLRNFSRKESPRFDIDKIPTTFIDLVAFRIVRDQFRSMAFFSSVESKSIALAHDLLASDFRKVEHRDALEKGDKTCV